MAKKKVKVKVKVKRKAAVKKAVTKKRSAPRKKLVTRKPRKNDAVVYTINKQDGEKYYYAGLDNNFLPVFDSDKKKATKFARPMLGLNSVHFAVKQKLPVSALKELQPLITERA